jgi:hypothetical protein
VDPLLDGCRYIRHLVVEETVRCTGQALRRLGCYSQPLERLGGDLDRGWHPRQFNGREPDMMIFTQQLQMARQPVDRSAEVARVDPGHRQAYKMMLAFRQQAERAEIVAGDAAGIDDG